MTPSRPTSSPQATGADARALMPSAVQGYVQHAVESDLEGLEQRRDFRNAKHGWQPVGHYGGAVASRRISSGLSARS